MTTINTAVQVVCGNDYMKSVANENPLTNAASSAINSADALAARLAALRKSLIDEKVNQKDINKVTNFLKSVIIYRAKLSQICAESKPSSGGKGVGVYLSSSNAIKASDDFTEKLYGVEVALRQLMQKQGSEDKATLELYLKEILTMRAETAKMRGELERLHWNSRDWPTDEIKGVKNVKQAVTPKTLEKQTGELYNYTKTLDSNLKLLYIITTQFGQESEKDVSSDLLAVQSLYADSDFIRNEAAKIYKNFGSIKPPVDIIDDGAASKGVKAPDGAKIVYDNPSYVSAQIANTKKVIKNLTMKLSDIHFNLVKAIQFSKVSGEEKMKYEGICEQIRMLHYFIGNSTMKKIDQLEKRYKN
ncbi:MAG: hypothetical protein ABH883_08715 [Candidatus Omnitrophota bacterium]